ncbi:hypothetical protein EV189_2105 [Motilibacter rhizosphaerae]|uniref:Uncharacterized protein n=1 Tax=Motilibacter rhizosphaerae TaxID=598652 RepID=A0A4Q7NTU5_9ACTN|nr:hypothetical protein [Motilibacter rhizosphaerae]RZS90320.1 hypothetical protein EV189_2105 [Motilibacter rhizosphaerae]
MDEPDLWPDARERVAESPGGFAAAVAEALPEAVRHPLFGLPVVCLLDVRAAVQDGQPVLYVVYTHPWWDFRTGLRRRLVDDGSLPRFDDGDPAVDLARSIAVLDLAEPLGRTLLEMVPDSGGTWWWGDEPLPGDATLRGRPVPLSMLTRAPAAPAR